MAMNPMQQQMSPDMLMAMMTDPRASPQQRMAAMSALNTMKGGANAPAPPPQMTGDSTGVSTIDPAFMAAVRQEVMGQGPEEQPEIAQRQAAPEAQQDPTTQALMSGAADASRVAAMARGGEVRGYAEGGKPRSELDIFLSPQLTDWEEQDRLLEEYQTKGEGKDTVPFLKDIARLAQRYNPLRGTSKLAKASEPLARDVINYFTGAKFEGDPRDAAPAPVAPAQPPAQYDPVQASGDAIRERIAAGRAMAAARAAAMPQPEPPPMEVAQQAPMPPPAAAQAPAPAVDPAAEAMNTQRQAESDAYKKRMEELLSGDQPLSSQDKYMALLQAGLGTMASASKPGATFLGSIGEGGMSGVQSLDELRKERAVNRMKQATMLQAQRSEDLGNEARNRQLDISERGVRVAEGKDARDAVSEKAEALINSEYKQALTKAALAEAARKGEGEDAFMRRVAAYRNAMPGASEQEVLDRAAGYDPRSTSSYTIERDAIAAAQRDPLVRSFAEQAAYSPTPENTKKYKDAYDLALKQYRAETGAGAKSAPPPPAGGAAPTVGGGNARPPLNSFGQ